MVTSPQTLADVSESDLLRRIFPFFESGASLAVGPSAGQPQVAMTAGSPQARASSFTLPLGSTARVPWLATSSGHFAVADSHSVACSGGVT